MLRLPPFVDGGDSVRFAYADPPYYKCAVKFYGDHTDAAVYDTIEGHQALVERLVAEAFRATLGREAPVSTADDITALILEITPAAPASG